MPIADVSGRTTDELVSLAGRRAVITGGAMGIGLAIARRYAEAGADIAIGDLDDVAAKEAADGLERDFGCRALSGRLDVADEASNDVFVDRVVRELGGIDIWVNNAGVYPSVPFTEMTPADWDRVIAVNLRGTFLGARAAAARMIEQGNGGVILNLASTAGYSSPGPGIAHYVTSKHGVRGFTKSLAVELGPYGIRVLAIAPTLIETPGIDTNRRAFEEAGLGDIIAGMAERLPLQRVGVPDDVARVALFCATEMSEFMTGSTLPVDGGDLAV